MIKFVPDIVILEYLQVLKLLVSHNRLIQKTCISIKPMESASLFMMIYSLVIHFNCLKYIIINQMRIQLDRWYRRRFKLF